MIFYVLGITSKKVDDFCSNTDPRKSDFTYLRHHDAKVKNSKDVLSEGVFSWNEDEVIISDGVERVYINEYKDVGDGKLYKGQWNKKTGDRDGVGIQFWPDGSKYEGMWRNDKANGKGRMTHANGDTYTGQWKDDRANGYGAFVDIKNAKYEGYWYED
jgi:hypothetical protein